MPPRVRPDNIAELHLTGDGVVRWANEAAAELFSIRTRVDQSLAPRLDLEDVSVFRRHLKDTVATGCACSPPMRLVDRRRVVQFFTYRLGPAPGHEDPRYHVCVATWSHYPTEIRSSRFVFRELLACVPFAVCILHHGIVEYTNAALLELLLDKDAPTIGYSLGSVLRPNDRGDFQHWLNSVGLMQRSSREWQIVHGDDIRWLQCDLAPLCRLGPGYVVFCAHDVTQSKRMQAELDETSRLASLGMLTAGIAHEINNPLSYVMLNLGELEELERERKSLLNEADELLHAVAQGHIEQEVGLAHARQVIQAAKARDFLAPVAAALEGANQVRGIVRDLRTLSHPAKLRARVSLREVIDRSLQMVAARVRPRAMTRVDLNGDVEVMADEGQLCQVLINLVVNAAQACTGGPAKNWIDVVVRTSATHVTIKVRDTGQGIPVEEQRRIFDPFFTTKAPGEGSGLGLSLCRSYVEAHDGRIALSSQVGVGTTVTVELPHSDDLPVEASCIAETEPIKQTVSKQRILFVEDEPLLREAVARRLRKHFRVETVGCGEDALTLLQADTNFDLIVSDLLMARGSGMELYQWLSSSELAPLAQRMVFVTGAAHAHEARAFLATSHRPVADKPLTTEELVQFIQRSLVETQPSVATAG